MFVLTMPRGWKFAGIALLLAGSTALVPTRSIAAPQTQPAESAQQKSAEPQERAVSQLPKLPNGQGVLGTIEGRTVEIRSETDAAIREVNCHEGQAVKRGDVLFQLDDASARAQVEVAKAEYELAEARAKTFENAGPGIVSSVEKNLVMAQRQVAASNLVIKEAALDQTRLVAPLSGVVTRCDAMPGEVASRGMSLASIVQLQPLRVRFSVPERNSDLHVGEMVGIYQP